MNGILLINKEKNCTSRDVVNDLVHIFNTKQVGHTGTLDPIATGVLVCTFGKYTKLNEALMSTYKEYIATMQLGILTDTLDITGTVLEKVSVNVSKSEIRDTINKFVVDYDQEVPLYSSVKVNGRKLYDYARNHETVTLPKKPVSIKNIDILTIDDDIITFKCLVSKGTYIRSLIRDIGVALKTNATMLELKRTKQGKFNIEESYTIDEVKNNHFKMLDINDVLDVLEIECDSELYKKVSNGVVINNNSTKEYILFKYNQQNVALYRLEGNQYKMFIKY